MIVLILIILVSGLKFYRLAHKNKRNKFLYTFLGLLSVFIGFFIFILIFGAYVWGTNQFSLLEEQNNTKIGFAGLTFCMLFSWGYYFYLKRKWTKIVVNFTNLELLDDNL